ncbi:MAG: GGDEF domain-containing protein, partial [Pseudomonadota bacterium]
LYNRRYAQKYLRDALTDAAPPNEAVTTMIVDIDHFKRINDTHGHAAGDAVLVEVARRMKDNLRTIDMVARYGGEEFLVVLPGTELSKAGPAADRLRRMIGSVPVDIEGGKRVRVTVSIGVSVCSPDDFETEKQPVFSHRTDEQVKRLIEAADRALYLAKETGRNRVKVAEG